MDFNLCSTWGHREIVDLVLQSNLSICVLVRFDVMTEILLFVDGLQLVALFVVVHHVSI